MRLRYYVVTATVFSGLLSLVLVVVTIMLMVLGHDLLSYFTWGMSAGFAMMAIVLGYILWLDDLREEVGKNV